MSSTKKAEKKLPQSTLVPPPPLGISTWPGWLLVGIGWLLARLPHRVLTWGGRALGPLLKRLMGRRANIGRRNISACFPQKDTAEVEQLLDQHFRSLGQMLVEIPYSWWGSEKDALCRHRIEGLEAVRSAHAAGKGVVLVSGHFTTIEVGPRLLCMHLPVAAIYRPHSTPLMEHLARKNRLKYGKALFRRKDTREMVRHLKSGGIVWYAPDQDFTHGQCVFAPFFDLDAWTITSTRQLARLSGAAVFFLSVRRVDSGSRYVLQLDPMPEVPGPDHLADCVAFNQRVEALARQVPEQYLWIHRRFKTRPEGEAPFYD